MEFNGHVSCGPASNERWYTTGRPIYDQDQMETLLESIARKWENYGFSLPRVVFWNLDARHENIPALGSRFSYVSGFSMSMVEQILGGEDGYSLMMKVLNNSRYEIIH